MSVKHIAWEDPPQRGIGTTSILDDLEILKENPERWALIYEGTQSGAAQALTAIKRAAIRRSEIWEAVTRRVDRNVVRTYARYMREGRS